MINKIIQEQLNKLQVAKLGEYDPFKHMYVIPKYKEFMNYCALLLGFFFLYCHENTYSYPFNIIQMIKW